GQEHSVGLLQHRQLLGILALLAGLERQHPDLGRLEVAEQPLVAASGGAQLGSGGEHGDARVAPAAQLDEALEDRLVARLVLGAADRNDEAALLAVRHSRWAHVASSLTRLSVAGIRLRSTVSRDLGVSRALPAGKCARLIGRESSRAYQGGRDGFKNATAP